MGVHIMLFGGVSGNPGGRPQEVGDVREMARDHTEEAIETLVDLMRHAKSDAARGAAAQALLDRGYGKSVAVSTETVDEGQAHLDALHEMLDRRERIGKEKTS
ncbi:MAG: HEAT repeat domain-containing protein [Alphaproteobacteria bacterium]|nr:HEAT repeat domain-containing protein [Alphaproteobacteria bacterium]